MDILKFQTAVLGLIISRPSHKCIGTIDHTGAITHCDAQHAIGPYNIVVKPTTNDTIRSKDPSERVLGQCVDPRGKTIAEIVRKNKQNRISLAKTSKAPVVAIVLPSTSPSKPGNYEKSDSLDSLARESKAMIDRVKGDKAN